MISIHSPHARGDYDQGNLQQNLYNFNPLPSCEGRLANNLLRECAELISIHSPHARGDPSVTLFGKPLCISIHSPHARGDLADFALQMAYHISIHSPHARGDAICIRPSGLS